METKAKLLVMGIGGIIIVSGCQATKTAQVERRADGHEAVQMDDRHKTWKEGILIIKQPQGQYVPLGGNAYFTVKAKSIGTTNDGIAYQWLHNLVPISSGTNHDLHVMEVTTN